MNTNYFLDCVAGNTFNTKTTPSLPTKYFIGLSTTQPNLNGQGDNEPFTDYAYSRVELTSLSQPTDGVVTNELATKTKKMLKKSLLVGSVNVNHSIDGLSTKNVMQC